MDTSNKRMYAEDGHVHVWMFLRQEWPKPKTPTPEEQAEMDRMQAEHPDWDILPSLNPAPKVLTDVFYCQRCLAYITKEPDE